jgi:FlaG protein
MDRTLRPITAVAADVPRHDGLTADAAQPAPPPARRRAAPMPSVPTPPPADLEAAYRAAGRVAEELAAQDVELHFEYDEAARRVIIEVRGADGEVIRQIPPRDFFAAIAGDAGVLLDRKA